MHLQVDGNSPPGGHQPVNARRRWGLQLWSSRLPQVQAGTHLTHFNCDWSWSPSPILFRPRRVYQDAEVDVTLGFTSQELIRLRPKRNLPNTTNSLLRLDPDSLVFYVGGYPEHFTVSNCTSILFSLCRHWSFQSASAKPEFPCVAPVSI